MTLEYCCDYNEAKRVLTESKKIGDILKKKIDNMIGNITSDNCGVEKEKNSTLIFSYISILKAQQQIINGLQPHGKEHPVQITHDAYVQLCAYGVLPPIRIGAPE